jgi:hypothetical protein
LLFAVSDALTNSANHITGFADTNPNLTALIANDNDRTEAQLFAAFYDLANATDLDDPLLPSTLFFFGAATFSTSCHSFVSC